VLRSARKNILVNKVSTKILRLILVVAIIANILVMGISLFTQAATMARYSNVFELIEFNNVILSKPEITKIYDWFKDLRKLHEWTFIAGLIGVTTTTVVLIKSREK
jgi:hypothetical protein